MSIVIPEKNEITERERRETLLKEYQNSSDYRKKLEDRLKITDACNRSNESKVAAAAACKKDPMFWFNNFAWTPNDKYEQYHFPFILYEFQEDFIHWFQGKIEGQEDGLVEKSREMGATWLAMSLFAWNWLFKENFNVLVGSYKEVLVDDRTKDSLFGMIEYQLRNIPKWMLPHKFSFKNNRTSMKLINPENQNVIKGDTMNPQFGRGSRRNLIFLDEGAYWEYFQDAWSACGDTTNCRLSVSTPHGYNSFAVLRDSGIDVKTLHWKLHPLKDEKWYAFEKNRRTEEEVARELDISYHHSVKGRVYPEWTYVEKGEFPYNPEMALYTSWDFGLSDDTAIIWWQKDHGTGDVNIIDVYWNNGKTIDFYIPFVTGEIPSDSYKYTKRDLEVIGEHKGWGRGTQFGDPAGRFRNQVVNQTVISVLRENGIHVNFNDSWKAFDQRIQASKMIMKGGRLKMNENKRTKYLDVCMINSQYAELKRGGQTIINSAGLKPRHDQYSHLRSAFEYGALGLRDKAGNTHRVRDKFQPNSFSNARRTISY